MTTTSMAGWGWVGNDGTCVFVCVAGMGAFYSLGSNGMNGEDDGRNGRRANGVIRVRRRQYDIYMDSCVAHR